MILLWWLKKILGYSLNTTDEKELKEAQDLLIQQKPLVYSYLVDEAQDEMIAENAAMAVVYSGEAGYALEFNENLAFSVPKEGSNMWVDAWFIPKTRAEQKNAELFLNYLCRADVAMETLTTCIMQRQTKPYTTSSTKNPAGQDNFPDSETLNNCEFLNLWMRLLRIITRSCGRR